MSQISIFDEIIVDNFAGGGGASIGIELALGQPVAVAINHDPAAILMHRTNHPHTEHLQASVWDVDPVEVCKGRPVGLAWFSPDCKHFSKAKGASLVDKKIRGLAWITLRWAAKVRPDVIMLENVEEFQTWGPVRKGKPIKKKAGQTFRKFIQQLEEHGSEKVRGQSMNDSIMTVDSSNRYGLTCASLVEYYGNGNPLDVTQPMHTVTAHDREAVVSAHIQKYFGGVVGVEASGPLPTVTTADHNALCSAHVVKFKGQELGQHPTDTLNTITAQGNEYAQCNAVLAKAGGHDLGHWPEIRALLNQHCGYHLADDEVILLVIFGVAYYIADITLRMLTPRELYNAMGFPPDYIIDYDYTGNKYPKNEQVARCGNAVCPPLAEAMVRANMPDMCGAKIRTMAELNDAIAV